MYFSHTFPRLGATCVLLATLALAGCGSSDKDAFDDGRGTLTCGGGSNDGAVGCMANPVDVPQPGMDPTFGPEPGNDIDYLTELERADMGVPAPRGLHDGAPHGPTPNQIPGGQVITTKGLVPLLGQGMEVHVFDVLGGPQTLPNAIPAAWAAQGGGFDDEVQQRLAQLLQQVTRGNRETPLVFYCQGTQCWMSYNAARRAIALGYGNVLWYRGGLEAWGRAGQAYANGERMQLDTSKDYQGGYDREDAPREPRDWSRL